MLTVIISAAVGIAVGVLATITLVLKGDSEKTSLWEKITFFVGVPVVYGSMGGLIGILLAMIIRELADC